MSASLKFKHMNINGVKLLMPLLQNENFLRYIKCLSDDPLNQEITNEELHSNLIQTRNNPGNILLKKFNENILTENKVFIFLSPYRPQGFTNALYSDIYRLDIIIPDDYVVLEGRGSWRYVAIAEEIAKEIDEQEVSGLGECYIVDYGCYVVDGYGEGMGLSIRVDNASRSGF